MNEEQNVATQTEVVEGPKTYTEEEREISIDRLTDLMELMVNMVRE